MTVPALSAVLPLILLLTATHHLNGVAAAGCDVPDEGFDAEEGAFLALLNQYRLERGAPPLTISANLNRSASWLAADLAAGGYFAHTDSWGRQPGARAAECGAVGPVGENIAGGTSWDSAAEAFEAWRGSPGHDANMLYAGYVQAGIARVYAPGSPLTWYWVADFSLSDDGTRLEAPQY